MIIVEWRRVFFFFGLLSIGLTPFLFVPFPYLPIEPQMVPVVIAAETMIYVLFAMIANPRFAWTGVVKVAGLLALARLALNLVGAAVLNLSPDWEGGYGQAWLALHVGNPLAVLLQMLLLLVLAPYLLHPIFPGLLTQEAAATVEEFAGTGETAERWTLSEPVGGYVQVYSFPELAEFLKKTLGLEGFMLYSDEGLVIWSSFEVQVDAEQAAVWSHQALSQMQTWAERLRIRDLRKILMETPEHLIFNLPITHQVRALVYFTSAVPIEDIMIRIDRMRRTIHEFLRWRSGSALA